MFGKIITVSGTSEAGKSFLVDALTHLYPNIHEIAGVTTRKIRPGEIEGKSSYFKTENEFCQLEAEEQLMLVKEFFGNKYAWFKSDLVFDRRMRIMNISYKSIQELRGHGLDIYAIFIRPDSEESLTEKLKSRVIAPEEYDKRIKDYRESEEFLQQHEEIFDFVFTNTYDEGSCYKFLRHVSEKFLLKKPLTGTLDERIKKLMKLRCLVDETKLRRDKSASR